MSWTFLQHTLRKKITMIHASIYTQLSIKKNNFPKDLLTFARLQKMTQQNNFYYLTIKQISWKKGKKAHTFLFDESYKPTLYGLWSQRNLNLIIPQRRWCHAIMKTLLYMWGTTTESCIMSAISHYGVCRTIQKGTFKTSIDAKIIG